MHPQVRPERKCSLTLSISVSSRSLSLLFSTFLFSLFLSRHVALSVSLSLSFLSVAHWPLTLAFHSRSSHQLRDRHRSSCQRHLLSPTKSQAEATAGAAEESFARSTGELIASTYFALDVFLYLSFLGNLYSYYGFDTFSHLCFLVRLPWKRSHLGRLSRLRCRRPSKGRRADLRCGEQVRILFMQNVFRADLFLCFSEGFAGSV
jgi:hypothetical protein